MDKNINYFNASKIGVFSKNDLQVEFVGTQVNKNQVILAMKVKTQKETRTDTLSEIETNHIMGLVHKNFNDSQISKQIKEVQDFIAQEYYSMII